MLVSSEEENEVSFSCFAKDFSPKDYEIKWLKDNKDITKKIYERNTPTYEESKSLNGTLYSAAGFLTVPSSEWTMQTTFTCQFKGKGENNVPAIKEAKVSYRNPTDSE